MWLARHEDGQQPAPHPPCQQQQRVAASPRGGRPQRMAGEQQGGGQVSHMHLMDGLCPLVHHCRGQELQQGVRRAGRQEDKSHLRGRHAGATDRVDGRRCGQAEKKRSGCHTPLAQLADARPAAHLAVAEEGPAPDGKGEEVGCVHSKVAEGQPQANTVKTSSTTWLAAGVGEGRGGWGGAPRSQRDPTAA